MRQGLEEMKRFAQSMYASVRDETFSMSCGFSDLVASCYGGRNRLVAMEWTQRQLRGEAATFRDLEESMLKGQKLQGVLTCNEVADVLRERGISEQFPLFTTIHMIVNGEARPEEILRYQECGRRAARRWAEESLRKKLAEIAGDDNEANRVVPK